MFQDSDALGGSGLGITNGTQPVAVAPALAPGIHLRWASAPLRGYPRHGSYVFRREHGDGITKPVSIKTDVGQSLIDSTAAEFERTRLAAATETGAGGSDWVEFTFTPRSYITQVDVIVSAGTTNGFMVTARTGNSDVDTATVAAGTIARQTVSVAGTYIETLRLEGDLGLVTDLRLHAQRDTLARGWADLPGVDQPVVLPLASDDHPATTAPGTLAAARTMAADRIRYGPATRFTASETLSTSAGSVSVTTDSPIVAGTNTDWGDELAGETFQLDGDSDAYTVLSVLDADRVVLSRAYAGSDASGMAYAIGPDRFASIHDSLATLLADGPSAGTQYRLHAGSTPTRTGAGLHPVSIGPQARLPPTGAELCIRGPDGVRHERWIDPGAAFTPATGARLARALDGTGLLLATGDDLAPGTYRFDVEYAREGDVTYRQDGDTSPERMTLDVVVTD